MRVSKFKGDKLPVVKATINNLRADLKEEEPLRDENELKENEVHQPAELPANDTNPPVGSDSGTVNNDLGAKGTTAKGEAK